MKIRKIKNILNSGKIISFPGVILRRKDDYIIEYKDKYQNIRTKELTKKRIKKINFKKAKIRKDPFLLINSAEKQMKLKFIQELINNFFEGSIISEYTHNSLKSRADLVVFKEGQCHVFELKSEKDNLNKLKQQIKDYKRYADYITVVINEKHLKKYEKFNFENINLIIETEEGFKIESIFKENNPNLKIIKKLVWYKEKENLFKGFRNKKKLSEMYSKAFKTFGKELVYKMIEERFRAYSDSIRDNSELIIESREEQKGCNINLKEFYSFVDKSLFFET